MADFSEDDVYDDEPYYDEDEGETEMSTGLDPEFFVLDPAGFIVPAEKFIDSAADGEARVVYDNAAVEVRPFAGSCLEGVGNNTTVVMRDAYRQMRLARLQGRIRPNSEISLVPAARLRKADMKMLSVQEFGCSPAKSLGADMTITTVKPIVDPTEIRWRSAGFHVHQSFGDNWSKAYFTNAAKDSTALCDALIGLVDVQMVYLAGHAQQSCIRRQDIGYGRAGEFRIRPYADNADTSTYVSRREGYGIYEYRTLSPWPLSHPIWSWWAASAVRQCCLTEGRGAIIKKLPDRSEIIDVINSCDFKGADKLWRASLRAWGTRGRGGNDALAEYSLERIIMAINGGGHEFFTLGWNIPRAWFKNEGGFTISQSIKDRAGYLKQPKTYVDYYGHRRKAAPFGTTKLVARSGTRYRYFPSGTQRIIEDHFKGKRVPSLPTYRKQRRI